jgi:DnaJ-class molecular chaperone
MIAAILMLIAGSGGGGWWWWNAHRKPTRRCPKCGGEKYVPIRGRSLISAAERFRKCPKCDGRGEVLKWQARRTLARQERRTST